MADDRTPRLGGHRGRPFEKGRSGNPAGWSRGRRIAAEYERMASEKITKKKAAVLNVDPWFVGKTFRYAMTFGQFRAAIAGETPAAREIADRTEGKVKDELELSGGLDITDPKARLLALAAAARKRQ